MRLIEEFIDQHGDSVVSLRSDVFPEAFED